jgi:anaerobic selenocysteine-containing dehydrogenase
VKTRPTWCGLCHARCGLLLGFENGRATSVRGDPDHPVSRGRTCERGRLMLEHLYNASRLDYPLRRIGGRGEGRFERVSWDAALDEICARLADLRDRFGPETVALTRGTDRTYHWDYSRFFNLLGSPNITGANPVCYCPSVVVESAICGAMPEPDVGHSACVVIWGSCRSTSAPVSAWPDLLGARRRGARVITVDPRRTPEAEMADLWLQIRPGTDAAMMLAWIDVICREHLYDAEFVTKWTVGFEDLRELAASFPPERAAEITWVPEDRIVAAARLYASTRPAAITWGFGLDKGGPNAQPSAHARAILRAITGNLDVVGGDRIGRAAGTPAVVSNLEMSRVEALTAAQRAKLLGGNDHPLFSYAAWEKHASALARLPDDYLQPVEPVETVVAAPRATFSAMLTGRPYPVRSLFCQAANPLLTLADPRRTEAALRSLDLLVVMDYYLTPSAVLADFVLPAACTVERDDMRVSGTGCIGYPRALDPLAERRSDYELWMALGRRLGQEGDWPWDSAREVCDFRLAPSGSTFAELVARGGISTSAESGRSRQLGFGTPSGRVELRSSILSDLGLDPLPSPPPAPGADPDFPLTLITGSNFNPMYHSEQRQWPSARSACPDPLVSLHRETAAHLGVSEGDWVRIESRHGAIRQRVRLEDRLDPRVVDTQHGWWFPERSGDPLGGFLEANCNVLTSDVYEACSPGTGGWRLTGLACRVVPDR